MPPRRQHPELDEKDQRIAEVVLRYPEATIEDIANHTHISASTVQKRVADMLDREQLARVIEVRDWNAAHYPVRYRIDVKVRQPALMETEGGGPISVANAEPQGSSFDTDEAPVPFPFPTEPIRSQKQLGRYIKYALAQAQSFRGRLVCLDVVILMGQQYDLSITIRAKDTAAVTDFVTRGLRFLRAISETMSSLEAWSCSDEERRSVPELASERQSLLGTIAE